MRVYSVIKIGVLVLICGCGSQEYDADPVGVRGTDGCAQVQAWIEEHRDALPSTYDEFSRFPMQYRRRIFAAHSANVRSSLWRAHLLQYDGTLTDDQQAVLDEAMLLATEDVFAQSVDTRDGVDVATALTEVQRRAYMVFSLMPRGRSSRR